MSERSPLDSSLRAHPYGLFLVVFGVFMVASYLFAELFGPHLGSIFSQILVLAGAARLYQQSRNVKPEFWPRFKHAGASPFGLGMCAVAAIALGLFANLLGALTVELIPALESIAQQYQETLEELLLAPTLIEQILGILAVAVVAPLCEEYLFRGTILPEQRRESGITMAIILNGLLFSFMHLNPIAFVPLAIVGAYLAHLTILSGSLWPAIIGHAALNTVNGVIVPRLPEEWSNPEQAVALTDLLLGLVVIAPLAIGLWWFTSRLLKRHQTT